MQSPDSKQSKSRPKKSPASYPHDTGPAPVVMESTPGAPGSRNIEKILSDILVKLERIEEKIDEAVYPPESAIKTAYIKKIKTVEAKIAKGDGKTYSSMDDFVRNVKFTRSLLPQRRGQLLGKMAL